MSRAIRASVSSGQYSSMAEAVRDAVRAWQNRRIQDAERLDTMRVRIRRSLEDSGPDMTLEEVDAHIESLFARADRAGGDEAAYGSVSTLDRARPFRHISMGNRGRRKFGDLGRVCKAHT